MDFVSLVDQIRLHSAALRAAAVKAGPEAEVPTCPEWTVHQLVAHVARSQSWPGTEEPAEAVRPPARPPDTWDGLLAWWDSESFCRTLLAAAPSPAVTWWARRSAHDVAIHRLDAEHAVGHPVPTLLFDPAFAADGVDELLGLMGSRPCTVTGKVLLHAADAGRVWNLHLERGRGVSVGAGAAIDVDLSVVGTADAVYRAMWRRPSSAIMTGDTLLLNQLRGP